MKVSVNLYFVISHGGVESLPRHGAKLNGIVRRQDHPAHLPSDQNSSKSHGEKCKM